MAPNALSKKIAKLLRHAGYMVKDEGKIAKSDGEAAYWLLMVGQPGRIVGHVRIYKAHVEISGFSRGGAVKNRHELETVIYGETR
jgi:hypothetical protein